MQPHDDSVEDTHSVETRIGSEHAPINSNYSLSAASEPQDIGGETGAAEGGLQPEKPQRLAIVKDSLLAMKTHLYRLPGMPAVSLHGMKTWRPYRVLLRGSKLYFFKPTAGAEKSRDDTVSQQQQQHQDFKSLFRPKTAGIGNAAISKRSTLIGKLSAVRDSIMPANASRVLIARNQRERKRQTQIIGEGSSSSTAENNIRTEQGIKRISLQDAPSFHDSTHDDSGTGLILVPQMFDNQTRRMLFKSASISESDLFNLAAAPLELAWTYIYGDSFIELDKASKRFKQHMVLLLFEDRLVMLTKNWIRLKRPGSIANHSQRSSPIPGEGRLLQRAPQSFADQSALVDSSYSANFNPSDLTAGKAAQKLSFEEQWDLCIRATPCEPFDSVESNDSQDPMERPSKNTIYTFELLNCETAELRLLRARNEVSRKRWLNRLQKAILANSINECAEAGSDSIAVELGKTASMNTIVADCKDDADVSEPCLVNNGKVNSVTRQDIGRMWDANYGGMLDSNRQCKSTVSSVNNRDSDQSATRIDNDLVLNRPKSTIRQPSDQVPPSIFAKKRRKFWGTSRHLDLVVFPGSGAISNASATLIGGSVEALVHEYLFRNLNCASISVYENIKHAILMESISFGGAKHLLEEMFRLLPLCFIRHSSSSTSSSSSNSDIPMPDNGFSALSPQPPLRNQQQIQIIFLHLLDDICVYAAIAADESLQPVVRTILAALTEHAAAQSSEQHANLIESIGSRCATLAPIEAVPESLLAAKAEEDPWENQIVISSTQDLSNLSLSMFLKLPSKRLALELFRFHLSQFTAIICPDGPLVSVTQWIRAIDGSIQPVLETCPLLYWTLTIGRTAINFPGPIGSIDLLVSLHPLCGYITNQLLNQSRSWSPLKRAQIIEYWIECGEELLSLGDRYGWLVVASALMQQSVVRLHESWRNVSATHRQCLNEKWLAIYANPNGCAAGMNNTNELIIPVLGAWMAKLVELFRQCVLRSVDEVNLWRTEGSLLLSRSADRWAAFDGVSLSSWRFRLLQSIKRLSKGAAALNSCQQWLELIYMRPPTSAVLEDPVNGVLDYWQAIYETSPSTATNHSPYCTSSKTSAAEEDSEFRDALFAHCIMVGEHRMDESLICESPMHYVNSPALTAGTFSTTSMLHSSFRSADSVPVGDIVNFFAGYYRHNDYSGENNPSDTMDESANLPVTLMGDSNNELIIALKSKQPISKSPMCFGKSETLEGSPDYYVKAGTLERLLDFLIFGADQLADMNFMSLSLMGDISISESDSTNATNILAALHTRFLGAFLGSFRSFCAPAAVLEGLKRRWQKSPSTNASEIQQSIGSVGNGGKTAMVTRQRILSVLGCWIENHFEDFLDDPHLMESLRRLMESFTSNLRVQAVASREKSAMESSSPKSAVYSGIDIGIGMLLMKELQSVREKFGRKCLLPATYSLLFQPTPSIDTPPDDTMLDFDQFSAGGLANALADLAGKLAANITVSEWLQVADLIASSYSSLSISVHSLRRADSLAQGGDEHSAWMNRLTEIDQALSLLNAPVRRFNSDRCSQRTGIQQQEQHSRTATVSAQSLDACSSISRSNSILLTGSPGAQQYSTAPLESLLPRSLQTLMHFQRNLKHWAISQVLAASSLRHRIARVRLLLDVCRLVRRYLGRQNCVLRPLLSALVSAECRVFTKAWTTLQDMPVEGVDLKKSSQRFSTAAVSPPASPNSPRASSFVAEWDRAESYVELLESLWFEQCPQLSAVLLSSDKDGMQQERRWLPSPDDVIAWMFELCSKQPERLLVSNEQVLGGPPNQSPRSPHKRSSSLKIRLTDANSDRHLQKGGISASAGLPLINFEKRWQLFNLCKAINQSCSIMSATTIAAPLSPLSPSSTRNSAAMNIPADLSFLCTPNIISQSECFSADWNAAASAASQDNEGKGMKPNRLPFFSRLTVLEKELKKIRERDLKRYQTLLDRDNRERQRRGKSMEKLTTSREDSKVPPLIMSSVGAIQGNSASSPVLTSLFRFNASRKQQSINSLSSSSLNYTEPSPDQPALSKQQLLSQQQQQTKERRKLSSQPSSPTNRHKASENGDNSPAMLAPQLNNQTATELSWNDATDLLTSALPVELRDLKPVKVVSLLQADASQAWDYKKRLHVFRVLDEERDEVLLQALSDEDMNDWIHLINRASAEGRKWFNEQLMTETRNAIKSSDMTINQRSISDNTLDLRMGSTNNLSTTAAPNSSNIVSGGLPINRSPSARHKFSLRNTLKTGWRKDKSVSSSTDAEIRRVFGVELQTVLVRELREKEEILLRQQQSALQQQTKRSLFWRRKNKSDDSDSTAAATATSKTITPSLTISSIVTDYSGTIRTGSLDATQIQWTVDNSLPVIVEKCLREVELRGLQEIGIYRLSGSNTVIKVLQRQFNTDAFSVDLSASQYPDINNITGLLKLYFRELPDPLLTYDLFERFVSASKIDAAEERLQAIKECLRAMPLPNYYICKRLMEHLQRITDYEDVNKMHAANLAIVFGPTLLRPPPTRRLRQFNQQQQQQQSLETSNTGASNRISEISSVSSPTMMESGLGAMRHLGACTILVKLLIGKFHWLFDIDGGDEADENGIAIGETQINYEFEETAGGDKDISTDLVDAPTIVISSATEIMTLSTIKSNSEQFANTNSDGNACERISWTGKSSNTNTGSFDYIEEILGAVTEEEEELITVVGDSVQSTIVAADETG